VIALSVHADAKFVASMLKAGATGYVLKECAFEELEDAIHAVRSDRIYLSKRITGVVVESYVRRLSTADHSSPPALTPASRTKTAWRKAGMEADQMLWSTTSSAESDATSRFTANDQPVRVGRDSGAKSIQRGTPPAYRQALVDRVRLQIANGTYETQAKIDALLPQLARDLGFFGRRTKQIEGWQAGRRLSRPA